MEVAYGEYVYAHSLQKNYGGRFKTVLEAADMAHLLELPDGTTFRLR